MHTSQPAESHAEASNPRAEHKRLESAVHRLFKELCQIFGTENPNTLNCENAGNYAVMLGGSLTGSDKLNRRIIIGVSPCRIISVTQDLLTHQSKNEAGDWCEQHLRLDSPEALFSYLRKQALSGKSFLHLGYEFYRYCDPALWRKPSSKQAGQAEHPWPDFLLMQFAVVGCLEITDDITRSRWEWHERAKNEGPFTPSQNLAKYCQSLWDEILATETNRSTENRPLRAQSKERLDAYRDKFNASLDASAFQEATRNILENIKAGNLYQANLSLRLEKNVELESPHAFYEALCNSSPAPFCAFLKTPKGLLISNSPERLLSAACDKKGATRLETRPIAGTRGRGATPAEDEALAHTLLENPKERAEHLMLVDLLRNDLGHVALAGSVHVDELLVIERYANVTHLVSNVWGTLNRQRYDLWDAIRAVFPGGTITGCPKIRCIEILNALEPVRREFYTGSLGYLDFDAPDALLDLNILIRTLRLQEIEQAPPPSDACLAYNTPVGAGVCATHPSQGQTRAYHAQIHVGAGIVADSIAAYEYRECHRKANALLGALYAAEHPEYD